jgi:uncharacterized membrane protein
MNEQKKGRKPYRSEVVWYSVFGVLLVFGLVVSILGMCAYNIGRLSDNPLYLFEKSVAHAFGGKEGSVADFRLIGTCFMLVAMVGFLISIYHYVSRATKEEAEKRRKEERMRILMEGESLESKPQGEVPQDHSAPQAR